MPAFKFHNLDFNLLHVFLAVYEEQSVARAAARLNVSPSAISHSLGRLRVYFQDELFVRQGSTMRPTRRATDLGPRVSEAMLSLEKAIVPSAFDPAEHHRRFLMILTPYWCRLVLPTLMDRFSVEARHSEIRVRPASQRLSDDFNTGRVDVGVVATELDSPELASELLFTDQWAWAMPEGLGVERGRLTLERLVEIPHVIVTPRLGLQGSFDAGLEDWSQQELSDQGAFRRALAEAGLQRTVSVNVPDLATGLEVASRSNHAVLAPRRLVEDMAPRLGLRLYDAPYPTPPIDSHMVWRRESESDAGVEWLKGLVRGAASAIGWSGAA